VHKIKENNIFLKLNRKQTEFQNRNRPFQHYLKIKRSKEVGHTMIIDVSHSLSTNGSRKKRG